MAFSSRLVPSDVNLDYITYLVLCLYDENKLLKRLFGPYRLEYNTGNKCDEDGRQVFERGGLTRPECLSFVPDEDAEYQTMIIPKFWFQYAAYCMLNALDITKSVVSSKIK